MMSRANELRRNGKSSLIQATTALILGGISITCGLNSLYKIRTDPELSRLAQLRYILESQDASELVSKIVSDPKSREEILRVNEEYQTLNTPDNRADLTYHSNFYTQGIIFGIPVSAISLLGFASSKYSFKTARSIEENTIS